MVKEEKKKQQKTLDDSVVITEDNIVLLSRVIALSALKKFQVYAYGINKDVYDMHKKLQYDIAKKKELDPYTDSYDLVQEASYFLCHHIGHKLGEFHSMSRTKHRDSIRMKCFKHLFSYLRKERLHIINTNEDDEILQFIPEKVNTTKEQDYLKINTIITKLAQTDLEKEILHYLYNRVEVNNIAEFLNISIWKIYKRRRLFKERYLMYCM